MYIDAKPETIAEFQFSGGDNDPFAVLYALTEKVEQKPISKQHKRLILDHQRLGGVEAKVRDTRM